MCSYEAAVLQQSMKLLGEDKCVWTERVSAERQLPEVSRVLHFTHISTSQHLTHFFNAAEQRGDGINPLV